MKNIFIFIFTCLGWYASSAISNNIGKEILGIFKFPITLTIIQFGLTATLSFIYGNFYLKNLTPFTFGVFISVFPLSLFQITSHIFNSVALTFITVSFSHTIKALSPLFTILTYRLFFGIIHDHSVYSSLLVLTCGVMLVVATNIKFHLIGFLCVLCATILFVIQNIVTKYIFSQAELNLNNTVKLEKLNLVFYSNSISFILMLPIWYQFESTEMFENGEFAWYLVYWFLLNGVTHFSQALLAFSVLDLVSPITYSIASLCKRIFVITASIIYFGDVVNYWQGFGLFTTFLGLYFYHKAESSIQKGESEITHIRRKKSLPIVST